MASGKATGKTDAPAPVIKLGGPKPPKVGSSGNASWFQAIKAKKLNSHPPKFEGSGVLIMKILKQVSNMDTGGAKPGLSQLKAEENQSQMLGTSIILEQDQPLT